MKKLIVLAVVAMALVVRSEEESADATSAVKNYACSLTVNPIRGTPREGRKMNDNSKKPLADSKAMQGFKNRPTLSGGAGAKGDGEAKDNTFKWEVEVRFRGKERPPSADVHAYYLGYDGVNRALTELGDETKTVSLDAGGRGETIMTSPSIPKKEIKVSTSDWRGQNNRKKESKQHPKRLTGCVVQVFAEGQLVASWASNSQWKRAAGKPKFSVKDLPGQPKPTAKKN